MISQLGWLFFSKEHPIAEPKNGVIDTQARVKELSIKIDKWARRFCEMRGGKEDPKRHPDFFPSAHIHLSPFNELTPEASIHVPTYVYCNSMVSIIDVPPLFLLKTEDIDARFLIKTKEDLKNLDDEEFMSDFTLHLGKLLGLEDFSLQKLNLFQRGVVQTFLTFISDSESSEAAKKFVLLHEWGHHYFGHTFDSLKEAERSLNNKNRNRLKKIGLVGLGVLSAIGLGLSSTLGLGVLAGGLYYRSRSQKAEKSRKMEMDCDTFAVELLESARGPVHLFANFQMHLIRARQNKACPRSFRTLITRSGETILFGLDSHPSCQERIDNARQVTNQCKNTRGPKLAKLFIDYENQKALSASPLV